MRLVDDWKSAYKWVSIHCLIAAGALSAFSTAIMAEWSSLPPEWQDILLHYYSNPIVFKIISFLSVFGVLGRLVRQSND